MKIPGIKNDEEYKALVCCRCGEVYFRRTVANGDRYEIKPSDCGYHFETGDLCPICNKEYKRMMNQFIGKEDESQNGY